MQEGYRMWHSGMSPTDSKHRFWGSRGPRPGNPTGSTLVGPLTKVVMSLFLVFD